MSRWLVYAGFALDGLGVVLLGPLLPHLESLWRIGDTQGGMLLAAMFFGMTAGTLLVLQVRRRAMVAAALCCSGGLGALTILLRVRLSPEVAVTGAVLALFVYGFGLGQAITTLNLAAGAAPEGRSARLAFGNALWSAGAILSPVLMALALRGTSLATWLAGLTLLFPLIWLPSSHAPWFRAPQVPAAVHRAGAPAVLIFCGMMFLYGSVESSLSGWVTTFAGREAHAGLSVSPLSVSAFWFGVASGRLLAGLFLRRIRERQALILLVGGACLAGIGLSLSQSMVSVSSWAALCGICIGPVFASIVSGVLSHGASSRQTGTVLAMCGAGATVMPFLLGVVSQTLESLRAALMVPGACLATMFLVACLLVQNGDRNVSAA